MDEMSDELLKSVSSPALKNLAEDYAEMGIDTFLDNPALKELPIVKSVIGSAKGIIAYRDRRYLKKVFNFLFQVDKSSEEDKTKFKQKMALDPEEVNKAGETVWEILDSISVNGKATMIGKIFQAYMAQKIDINQLTYLCEIIERAHIQDLISLERSEIQNDINLENIGIKKPLRTEDVNTLIEKAFKEAKESEARAARAGKLGMSLPVFKTPTLPDPNLTEAGYSLINILRSY